MKLRRAAAAAVCLTALATPAAASAADPPPGAAMSDNLEYVDRDRPDAAGITEGKFDRVAEHATSSSSPGRFGFKTYDVTDPANPRAPRHVHAARDQPARNGYWQDEDMELDTKRNLIIGALDPRHNETDPVASGCPDNDGAGRPRPGLPQRLLRHLLLRPGEPHAGRRLRLAARRPHGELHPGLQVHLDRRPGAALGPGLPRPDHHAGPRRRPPSMDNRLIGDGRPIWVTDLRNPAKPVGLRPSRSTCGATTATRTTRTTSTRTSRASPGSPAAAASAATRPPAGTATRTRTASPRGDAVRPDPRRRRRRRLGRPERQRRRRHRAARDADAQLGPPDGRLRASADRRQERQRARSAPRRTSRPPTAAATAAGSCCPTSPTRSAASPPRSRRCASRTG